MTQVDLVVILQNNGMASGGVAEASRRLAQGFRDVSKPVPHVLELSLWGGGNSILQRRDRSLIWRLAASRGLQSKLARASIGAKRRAARELLSVVPDERATVVVATDVLAAEVLARAGYQSARTLTQYHGSYAALSSGRDLERLTEAATNLDRLLMLTPADAAELTSKGTPATYAPNILDWPPAEPTQMPVQRRVIAAGRLAEGKNFQRLISAWSVIANQHPDWSLDIFGAGPERESLERQIADGNLGGAVRLRGACADLRTQLPNYDFLTLSSDYEGLPLVIVEAMSQGLPVVATDCSPGVRLQIEESGAGWLTDCSVDGLAAGLMDAIRECGTTTTRRDLALNYASRFDPQTIIDRWAGIIHAIQRGPSATAG